VKSRNFQDIALTRPKSALSSILYPTMTLNFNLLNPKLSMFILIPKCTNAKSLVRIHSIVSRYCVNNVQDTQTETQSQADRQADGLTNSPNASSHYVGEGIKIYFDYKAINSVLLETQFCLIKMQIAKSTKEQ